MLAGDEQARRKSAKAVECQGDPSRAALLRVGLPKQRRRSLDAVSTVAGLQNVALTS